MYMVTFKHLCRIYIDVVVTSSFTALDPRRCTELRLSVLLRSCPYVAAVLLTSFIDGFHLPGKLRGFFLYMAALFNCTPVDRASDSMMAPT